MRNRENAPEEPKGGDNPSPEKMRELEEDLKKGGLDKALEMGSRRKDSSFVPTKENIPSEKEIPEARRLQREREKLQQLLLLLKDALNQGSLFPEMTMEEALGLIMERIEKIDRRRQELEGED